MAAVRALLLSSLILTTAAAQDAAPSGDPVRTAE